MQVPVGCDEDEDDDGSGRGSGASGGDGAGAEVNPMADFLSTDILTKPFNFVGGNATKSRFNPFRKKSGLLNVLARQSTRNRIVGKSGALNLIMHVEGKSHKFLKVIPRIRIILKYTLLTFLIQETYAAINSRMGQYLDS